MAPEEIFSQLGRLWMVIFVFNPTPFASNLSSLPVWFRTESGRIGNTDPDPQSSWMSTDSI